MAISGNAMDVKLVRRMFRYAKPYKKYFYGAVLLTILIAVITPLRPFLIEHTIDNFIIVGDTVGLTWMLGILFGVLIFQTFLQYWHTFSTNFLGQAVIKDMRVAVFNHITSLRLKYFDKTTLGQLITRTISDLETIADVFSEGVIVIIGDILQIVTIILVMYYTDWKLTLIVLIPMPFLMVSTYIFKEAIKSAFQAVRNEVAKLNTFLQEHITGMTVIQLFAREEREYDRFKTINNRHKKAHIRSNWYYSIFFPVVDIIYAVSIGLLVWFGAKSILQSDISPGVIVAFIMYINMLYRPIRELADKFNTLQMGMVSAERIFKVLDTEEKTENKGTYQPETIKGSIVFKNVWFAYTNEDWVLRDISFEVKPGETLALVGATGAGKSSTINILNRFYEISKGEVKIDGVDIHDFELSNLRSNIATVLQDVFLYSDTIYNNITLKDPSISLEQVIAAAKEVGAHEFIQRLPGGYHYNVQERGNTLSVGQAQLIAFIRAMVYNPKILVLDEATSSVDTETEEWIQKAILKLMQGRTSIVIAHRLSTIQNADKIIVLEKGEIKEMGNHQQLLKMGGYYKRLYELQINSAGISV